MLVAYLLALVLMMAAVVASPTLMVGLLWLNARVWPRSDLSLANQ